MTTTGYWIEKTNDGQPEGQWVHYLHDPSNEIVEQLRLYVLQCSDGPHYCVERRTLLTNNVKGIKWKSATDQYKYENEAQGRLWDRLQVLIDRRDELNKQISQKAYETQGVEL